MSREDGYRLVHFDLKGAPPRLPYLQKILPLLKTWGVNGLLVEYEDMFPYEGELQVLARPEAYSKDNIQAIVELATENGMTVIPLVQTFGHMEFVLKHPKFAGLRESPEHCRSICPSNPESRRVVLAMLGQVLSLHPTARWVHIGADEVYHLGECDMCRQRMVAEGLTKERLFLSHVRSVAEAIKQMFPFTQLIMWDDMFRLFEALVIKDSGIGSLVEPMVWYYQPNDIPVPDLWERYSQVFPTVWLASAYKGATGVYQYATDATYHLGNHLMWLLVLERESAKFEHIRGVALTGWQRYDHFTVLCELLPAAIPSLGLCLETLDKGSFTTKVHEKVSSDLKCNGLLPLNPFQLPDIPECKFPGSDIYMMCSQLVHLDAQLEYKVLVQFRPQPVNIAGPDSTESTTTAQRLLDSYEDLGRKLTVSLSEVYFPHTVEEWLSVYINPKLARLKELL